MKHLLEKYDNLNHAAFANDVEAVKAFLKIKVLKRDIKNGYLNATSKGYFEVVKLLINYNKKHNLLKPIIINEGIYKAAYKGYLNIFKYLYKDPSVEKDIPYLLNKAISYNNLDIIKFITKNENIPFNEVRTNILSICSCGQLGLLKFWINQYPQLKKNQNLIFKMATLALENGRTSTLRYLLENHIKKFKLINNFFEEFSFKNINKNNYKSFFFIIKTYHSKIKINLYISQFLYYLDYIHYNSSDKNKVLNQFLTIILKDNIKKKISLSEVERYYPDIIQKKEYKELRNKIMVNKIANF